MELLSLKDGAMDMLSGCLDCTAEVSRTVRDVQPAHYLFKIESFSTLVDEEIDKYESDDFEVGDYKWGLCLYPSGNKKRNGKGYLSLYLVIKDTDKFPNGWEVTVQFKLFVYDHIQDKYLTIQDAEGKTRRFHAMKTEWGFAQLLSLDTFNNASNGYLFDDSCVFGAEIFVIKYSGKGECVSWIKEPKNNSYVWEIDNFSSITKPYLRSEEFTIGEQKWKLLLYPGGGGKALGESLSLFLCWVNSATPPLKQRHYARYKLRIKDQLFYTHHEKETSCWFCASIEDWGFWDFKKLCDLKDSSKGYIVKDTLIVEVEIMVMSVVKKFP